MAGLQINLSDVTTTTGDGKVLTWDTSTDKWIATDLTLSGVAGGDLTGSYPNPSIGALAIGTSKLADNAVTSAKINTTGIATNRLLITDATAGGSVTYANCAADQVLKFVVGTGWQCASVSSLSPVSSVAGKTGAVTLNAMDIGGLGTASLYNIGIGSTEIPQLDTTGKLAASTIPLFAGDVTGAVGANIVTKIQGRDILNSVPNANDVLRWNNAFTRWEASAVVDNGVTALTGDVSASGSGSVVATLTNGVVTTPKMFTNPGVNRLVATDNGSGATLVPFTCNLTETMQWTATGWTCVTPAALIGTGFIADGGNTRGSIINVGTNDAFALNLETNNTPRLTVLSGGNVGIGTTNPSNALDVTGAISSSGAMSAGGNLTSGGIVSATGNITSGASISATNNISGANVYANTSLGIGTTSPARILEVAGVMRVAPSALPGSPGAGDVVVDSGAGNTMKYHNGTSWISLAVGGTGDFKADGTVPMTGAFRSIAGSAAAPGLSFFGDTDNGLFLPATDNLALGTSGAERLRILANGNIGVGTTNPTFLMDINGTGRIASGLTTTTIGATNISATNLAATGNVSGASVFATTSMGIGTTSPNRMLEVAGAVRVQPSSLPGSPAAGDIVIDSGASNSLKYHNGTSWISLAVGGTGDFKADGTVAMTGAFRSIAGNAAAPGVSFVGDTDTGIYSPGSDNLALGTAGSERIRILADGTVGIGTTAPDTASSNVKLDIRGNLMTATTDYVDTTTGSSLLIGTTGSTGNVSSRIQAYTNGRGGVADLLLNPLTGNVGIGTTAPARPLHVAGAMRLTPAGLPGSPSAGDIAVDSGSGNNLMFHNGTSWVSLTAGGTSDFMANGTVVMTGSFRSIAGTAAAPGVTFVGDIANGAFAPAANTYAISTSGAERMRVLSGGNVGIGTTNPSGLLSFANSANDKKVVLYSLSTDQYGIGLRSGKAIYYHGPVGNSSFGRFDGTTFTDQLYVQGSTGNVGIGTTAPSRLLSVNGSINLAPGPLPASPAAGDIAIDGGASNSLTYHNGTSWVNLSVGGTGDFKADGSVAMTGSLRHIGGSASAPGLTFTGDTDNGIFAPAADNIAIGTAGSEKLRVLANGNVGIGTTNPNKKLQVVASGSSTDGGSMAEFSSGTATAGNLYGFGVNKSGTEVLYMGINKNTSTGSVPANAAYISTWNTTGPLSIGRGGGNNLPSTSDIFINSSGNVGIGTTSPNRILEVAGAVRISPATLPGSPAAGDMVIDSGASNSLKYHNGTSWISLAVGGTGDFKADGTVAMTGAFRSIAGIATAPGMAFFNDTDNGIFAPAADNFAIATSGSEKLRVRADGNVGIGTTNPGARLDVRYGASTPNALMAQIGSDSATRFKFYDETPTKGPKLTFDAGNPSIIEALGGLTYESAGVEHFRITAAGNVGIGTTSPLDELSIVKNQNSATSIGLINSDTTGPGSKTMLSFQNDTSNAAIQLSGFSGTLGMDNSGAGGILIRQLNNAGNFVIQNGASPVTRFLVQPDGNVGIGSTSPRATLDVSGPIVGKASVVNATTTINFSSGNIQHTTQNCGAFALNNLKDGGSYIFVVQGGTAATCSFTAFSDSGTTALTVKLPPGHGATTAGTHTFYNIIVAGSFAYFSWTPGY